MKTKISSHLACKSLSKHLCLSAGSLERLLFLSKKLFRSDHFIFERPLKNEGWVDFSIKVGCDKLKALGLPPALAHEFALRLLWLEFDVETSSTPNFFLETTSFQPGSGARLASRLPALVPEEIGRRIDHTLSHAHGLTLASIGFMQARRPATVRLVFKANGSDLGPFLTAIGYTGDIPFVLDALRRAGPTLSRVNLQFDATTEPITKIGIDCMFSMRYAPENRRADLERFLRALGEQTDAGAWFGEDVVGRRRLIRGATHVKLNFEGRRVSSKIYLDARPIERGDTL